MDSSQQDNTHTADLAVLRSNIINSLEQAANLDEASKPVFLRDTQILFDMFRFEMEEEPPPAITVAEIIDRVAAVRGVTRDKLLAQCRTQRMSHFRDEAMWLARKLTERSFPELGEAFHRDHSTVIYACQMIERRVAKYPAFQVAMEQLERTVKGAAA